MNMKEVRAVIGFIKILLGHDGEYIAQSDIGVVSPYKLQCKIIQNECEKNNLNGITIGTAEVFQGREKKIIIISTVRAQKTPKGDFFNNAQVCFKISMTLRSI